MLTSASSIGLPSCVSVSTRLNSLCGRLGALFDDRLDALAEAVARLERRGDRDQQVGQLVLEAAQAAARLPGDVARSGWRTPIAISDERQRATDRPEHRDEERQHERARRRRSPSSSPGRSGRSARSISRSRRLNCLTFAKTLLDRVDEPGARRRAASLRRAPLPPSVRRPRCAARCRRFSAALALRRRTRSQQASRIRRADDERQDRAVPAAL